VCCVIQQFNVYKARLKVLTSEVVPTQATMVYLVRGAGKKL